jgi:hypothetical protein
MTISLPSKEIYAVDVPEVESFDGTFHYNFHTPDESITEDGGIPTKFLKKNASDIDSAFIQYSMTRAPRFISFTWKIPNLAKAGSLSFDQYNEGSFTTKSQNGSLISDNLDKIVSEDKFATSNYIAVDFHDGDIDNKLYQYLSGSCAMRSLDDNSVSNTSEYKMAQKLSSQTPTSVTPSYIYRILTNQANANGTRFYKDNGSRIYDDYSSQLKSVTVNMQANSKLLQDMIGRLIVDPMAPYSTELRDLYSATTHAKNAALQNATTQVTEEDYKTYIPYIDVTVQKSVTGQNYMSSEIIGFIIDKFEIDNNGSTTQLKSIIIDKASVGNTVDYKIKYNSKYAYSIRTIALFTMPAINDDTNEVALIRTLVSSKPSNFVVIKTNENIAPPAPANINFTWDYERINPLTTEYNHQTGKPYEGTGVAGSLMIHWNFPANPQRDIKRFQVFRRKDIESPFELLKEYNFDDSILKFSNAENPDASLVENVSSPVNYYFDDEFQVGNHQQHNPLLRKFTDSEISPWSSAYIYAIAAIDAHGYTSPYSAQYLVWFDPFKNKLQKTLISHSGAPKPYPNLFLNADTFVDTIKVSGPNSKRMKVYFNPDFYYVVDGKDNITKTVATKQDGKSYKLQFINIDNQKTAVVNIAIDDKLSLTQSDDSSALVGRK